MKIPTCHCHFRRACRPFLRDGSAIIPHQRRASWQADRPAQAWPVLVETRTFTARTGRRAGEFTAADDACVYRNGILIGRSSISSGSKGNSTPPGVFNILEKKETHYSKKYDNAPMPNMQRLTWTGIAMHSGQLPGYPASHGCIRLPYDFSALLFDATSKGGTVVIGDGKTPQPHLASNPGLMLAPKDLTPAMVRPLAANEYDWRPERSPSGPITIVISSADKALYVYRKGNPIGRAALEVKGRRLGEHVFTLLEGTTDKPSQLAPGREAGRWMRVDGEGSGVIAEKFASRLRFSPEFAKVADTIAPGTTVIVTDAPAVRKPVVD
jgi:hypothetical protein